MTLLNRVMAVLALSDGETVASTYHELRLQRWDEARNDSVSVYTLYLQRGEPIPMTLEFDGHTYTQGQCSGVSMNVVWFDRV